jgi:hypothetical protein
MLEDKAMIIIAVSKYAGAYGNLPGAITSARRLREWAEQPDEDCNYKVLYLADDAYPQINVRLLESEITRFVGNNFIERLVVYFAGHGIVRAAGEQFWLLTNADENNVEGINVEAFKRGLLKYNIGSNGISGQLCIIGDACRDTTQGTFDFCGHPILTSRERMNPDIELDRFLSTGLGDYSLHINQGTDSQREYCLFSEVMLSALRGDVKEAIETKNHEFKPAVTNHKLKSYLLKEVRNRAGVYEEKQEPDIDPGISPPYNFYKKIIIQPGTGVVASSQDQQLAAAIRMTINDSRPRSSNEQLTRCQKRRKQTLLQWKNRITLKNFRQYLNRNYDDFDFDLLTISDFRPNFVAIPHGAEVKVVRRKPTFLKPTFYQILVNNCGDSPILIHQDEQWMIIPDYLNVVTVVSRNLPGDILFLKNVQSIESFIKNKDELWDTFLSDFSNLVGNVPLRAADAQKFADKIRVGKEKYPHQAVTAGYLYEFSNDYNNIARTAHYMYENTGGVPFDLALLCADKIWWIKKNDRFVAFADLPAVEPSQISDNEEDRPYYARSGFKERKNVRLLGIAPIFRQGWSFMQTELYLEIPEEIRLIGEKMNGRSAASLTDKGLRMFLEAFDYRVVEIDT